MYFVFQFVVCVDDVCARPSRVVSCETTGQRKEARKKK
jgi:hypothetical protein